MKINGNSLGWAIIWIILFTSLAFGDSGIEDIPQALFYIVLMCLLGFGIVIKLGDTFERGGK